MLKTSHQFYDYTAEQRLLASISVAAGFWQQKMMIERTTGKTTKQTPPTKTSEDVNVLFATTNNKKIASFKKKKHKH